MHQSLLAMAAMGLLTSVVAPAIVLSAGRFGGLGSFDLRAAVALPGFVVVHALITLGIDGGEWPQAAKTAAAVFLLLGAMAFWAPVLGSRHRLPVELAGVYLFVACPALDLPAVIMVARGNAAGGLAMIIGMLPIGITAVALTWRWITAEEGAERLTSQ
jgi:hypothetical protein